MYTSDQERPGGAYEPPYQPGRNDPLRAATAMAQAGVLTPAAARAIEHFSAVRAANGGRMADAGWDGANTRGWVAYRGVIYAPAGFNRLWAMAGTPDGPDGGEPDEEATNGEWWEEELRIEPTLPLMPTLPPSLPMLQVFSRRPSRQASRNASISDGPHGRLFAALALLGALLLFAASLVAVAWMTGVLLLNTLSQLIALLIRGFLTLLGG